MSISGIDVQPEKLQQTIDAMFKPQTITDAVQVFFLSVLTRFLALG